MPSVTAPEFEKIADKWAEAARPADVPPCLYHYTDADGLLGMLGAGSIWATDYRFLNDRAEMEHTRARVREIVTQRLSKSDEEIRKKLYSRILNDLVSDIPYDLFVFSMSEDKDDLSQWRAYARDGQGFTIGFCAETLRSLMLTEEAEFGIRKIEYDQDVQVSTLITVLDDIEGEFQKFTSGNVPAYSALVSDAAYWFNWVSHARAASNKHQSFRTEREWRLITFAERESTGAKIRSRGLGLVRYLELLPRANGEMRLPIKEIGIGPGFVGSEEVHAVKEICRANGYAPNIYFADTPYRRI